jgi:hypothetical protein
MVRVTDSDRGWGYLEGKISLDVMLRRGRWHVEGVKITKSTIKRTSVGRNFKFQVPTLHKNRGRSLGESHKLGKRGPPGLVYNVTEQMSALWW